MMNMGKASTTCGWILLVGCIAPSSMGGSVPLKAVRVASGLSSPLFVTHAPSDFDRVFIIEQTGQIRILAGGSVLATPFLNVDSISSCCGERGLLGLAFHPNYASNGQFYINYTNNAGNTVVARYTVSANPNVANAAGQILLTIIQPFANHNGGWLGFGPDGYLYVATGDGGSGNDPNNHAQTITGDLLGKMLRINVDTDDFPADPNRNYGIPANNPFVGVAGDDEIWAYGLRNPWRPSFDRATGDLYIADVGQSGFEEIDFQPASSAGGENYGWRCMEGNSCTALGGCVCFDATLTDPIFEYTHGIGCSITGGYNYRGCSMPSLQGTYFYADYCADRVWSFEYDGVTVFNHSERTAELQPDEGSLSSISSFGEDAFGEVYICSLGGDVFKIVLDVPPDFPESSAQGGCNNCSAPGAPIADGATCSTNANCNSAGGVEGQCINGNCHTPKNRYLTFDPSPLPTGSSGLAFRVTLASLPGPTDCPGLPDYSVFEGQQMWVGAPGSIGVSQLVNSPVYRIWGSGVVVSDCNIVPCASYAIDSITDACPLLPASFSSVTTLTTATHWGDVSGTSGSTLSAPDGDRPDFIDIGWMVDRFKNDPRIPATERPRTDLCKNVPDQGGGTSNIDFQDIGCCVDAFQNMGYDLSVKNGSGLHGPTGTSGPCAMP